MKILKISLMMIVVLLSYSCDNEDNNRERNELITLPILKQTLWEGTIIYDKGNNKKDYGEVRLLFLTDKRGNSIVSNYYGHGGIQQRDFEYSVDDKLLIIDGPTIDYTLHYLDGDWMLTSAKKDEMVLVRGLNDYPRDILELHRIEYEK